VVPLEVLLYARGVVHRRFKRAFHRLAVVIRRRRTELGLSQEDVAHAMGVATRHYQKLEAGELNPTFMTLLKAAEALEIDPSALLR
jgi:transcriptional regulator with XRE-family HTH domain